VTGPVCGTAETPEAFILRGFPISGFRGLWWRSTFVVAIDVCGGVVPCTIMAMRPGVRVPAVILVCCLTVCCPALTAGCGSAGSSAADQAGRDGTVVRCLSQQYRSQLADAAVALRLADRAATADQVRVGGHDLSLEQWRDQRPADFTRGCAALSAAVGAPGGGTAGAGAGGSGGSGGDGTGGALLAAVLSLLVAVLTAVVGAIVTAWINGSGRRRQLADAVRTAALAVSRAGIEYLAGFEPGHRRLDGERLRATLVELDGQLQQVAFLHSSWRVVGLLRGRLTSAPLDEGLDVRMSHPADNLAAAREEVRREITYRVEMATWVAHALETPLRSARKLRAALPGRAHAAPPQAGG